MSKIQKMGRFWLMSKILNQSLKMIRIKISIVINLIAVVTRKVGLKAKRLSRLNKLRLL